jgi:hypothetical protein
MDVDSPLSLSAQPVYVHLREESNNDDGEGMRLVEGIVRFGGRGCTLRCYYGKYTRQ